MQGVLVACARGVSQNNDKGYLVGAGGKESEQTQLYSFNCWPDRKLKLLAAVGKTNAAASGEKRCRCGSTTHLRVNHSSCPLNPKNKNQKVSRMWMCMLNSWLRAKCVIIHDVCVFALSTVYKRALKLPLLLPSSLVPRPPPSLAPQPPPSLAPRPPPSPRKPRC